MKRLLCVAFLGAYATTAVPANAANCYSVNPIVWDGSNGRVGAGAEYSRDCKYYDPVGGAWVNVSSGTACVGLSYQIPLCVGGPIE